MANRVPVPPEAIRVAAALVFMAAAYFLWQPGNTWSLLSKWLLIFFAGLAAAYNLLMLAAMGIGLYLRPRDPAKAFTPLGDGGRAYAAPRWHDALVALGCLVTVATYDILAFDAHPPLAVMLTALAGFWALFHAVQVISPSRLRLTEAGFEVNGAFDRIRQVAWRDIEPIFVFDDKQGFVSYRYRKGRRPTDLGWFQRWRAGHSDVDGMLPGGLDLESWALRDLMNEMREHSLAAAGVRDDVAGSPTSANAAAVAAQPKHSRPAYSRAQAHRLFVRIGVFTIGGLVLMLGMVGGAFLAGSLATGSLGPDQSLGAAVAMVSIIWLIFVLSGQSTLSVTPRRGFVLAGMATHPALYWATVATFAVAELVGAWLYVFRPFSH
ncbi:MAG TPA: hypothetical protein VGI95_07430 [Caulobacteraceae bacterium]|jgi:hypothetical protein